MKTLIIVLLLSSFLILGCATPYQATALAGGYSEIQLSENMFKVSFTGNGYTSQERATDFALLRSAEVATNNGFDYFAIVSDNTYSEESTYQQPTTSQSKSTVHGNTVRSTTTTSGGQTYIISKPRTANTILCYKEKPDGIFYDVKFIIPSIKSKYGITK